MTFKVVEVFTKSRYIFDGPVYSENGLISGRSQKETRASSRQEAVDNIKKQFYAELGMNVIIDPNLVILTEISRNSPNRSSYSGKQLTLF